MNIFHKVTLRSLLKNRVRTAVTIIGILLSAAMICAVTTFASSLRNFAVQGKVYSAGNWHGRALGRDYSVCNAVLQSDAVEEAAVFQELGYAALENSTSSFKPYLYLLGAEGAADGVFPIHLTAGTFPSSSEEILLPETLLASGGLTCALGDKLTLALGQRVYQGEVLTQSSPYRCWDEEEEQLEIRESRSYTVVGFYEQPRSPIENSMTPGYTALTVADPTPSEAYGYDVYFRMNDPDDIYTFMSNNGLGDDTNRDLLLFSGTFRFDSFNTLLYSMAAIVIGLIMFGSVALIYNAFSISVSERTKEFGLLSSVGATKKQLRRSVFFEAFAVSLIGIPLGILSGIGGIGVTLWLIGDKFRALGFGKADMTLSVSPLSVAVAATVALVTVIISAWIPSLRATKVSAVEAIRQNADVALRETPGKPHRLTYRLFGLPGVLAQKYYRRSRKKYRATVLSLFMSVVLFVSASAFTGYLGETVTGALVTPGYDLIYLAEASKFERITPDDLLQRMRTATGVTGASYTLNRSGFYVEIPSDDLTSEGISFIKSSSGQDADGGTLGLYLAVAFVDDDSFRDLLKENKLDEARFMNPERPLALVLDGIRSFNAVTEKYETADFFRHDEFEVEHLTTKTLPGYTLYDIDEDNSGKRIFRYLKDGTDYEEGEIITLDEEAACTRSSLSVGKVLTEMPAFITNYTDRWLIYPASLASAVIEDFAAEPTVEYRFTVRSESHAESCEEIKTILAESGFSYNDLCDVTEQNESDRSIITIVQVFSYGFIVLISLIAAANVFNTISTNIQLRRREFAMLRSVGMTRAGFNRMMNYECLLYGSRALLYGLPASGLVTFLIYRSVLSGYETAFRLPWPAIGIAVLSVFLVVFATMMYAMSKIKKENPIDALKNENL